MKLVDEYESKNISWAKFESEVVSVHLNRIGAPHIREAGESPKLEENFYANPLPGCICQRHHDQEHQFNRRLLRLS